MAGPRFCGPATEEALSPKTVLVLGMSDWPLTAARSLFRPGNVDRGGTMSLIYCGHCRYGIGLVTNGTPSSVQSRGPKNRDQRWDRLQHPELATTDLVSYMEVQPAPCYNSQVIIIQATSVHSVLSQFSFNMLGLITHIAHQYMQWTHWPVCSHVLAYSWIVAACHWHSNDLQGHEIV